MLARVGHVTASVCAGYIATPKEMKKFLFLPPIYGALKNPPISDYNFIRVPNKLSDFSEKEKRLIEEAFGFSKDETVIWFSSKSIDKWTLFNNIQSLHFTDKDQNKWYFLHTRFSGFRNLRELSVLDDICQINVLN